MKKARIDEILQKVQGLENISDTHLLSDASNLMSLLLNSNDTKLVALAYRIREKLDNNPVWQVAKQLNQAEITSSTTPRYVEEQLQAERQQVINNNNTPQQQTLAQREVRIQQELRAAGLDSDMLRIISFSTGFQISREALRIEHLLDKQGEIDKRLTEAELRVANNALAANGELANVDNAAKVGNALLKQQNSPFELKAEDNQLKWTNNQSEVDEKTSDKLSGAVATVTVKHQSDSTPQKTQNVESVNQRTLAAGADYTNSLAGKDLYLLGLSLDKAAMAHLDPKLVDKNKPEEERIALFEQYERENSYSFHQLKNALVQTQDSKNTKAQSKVANDDHLIGNFSVHEKDPQELATRLGYYRTMTDMWSNKAPKNLASSIQDLSKFDVETRFKAYEKAKLGDHIIRRIESDLMRQYPQAYEKDLAKHFGEEEAKRMIEDLEIGTTQAYDPAIFNFDWGTLKPKPKASDELKEEQKKEEQKDNPFLRLTPSQQGEKNTSAAEEEEKINKRYITEEEKAELEKQEALKKRQQNDPIPNSV